MKRLVALKKKVISPICYVSTSAILAIINPTMASAEFPAHVLNRSIRLVDRTFSDISNYVGENASVQLRKCAENLMQLELLLEGDIASEDCIA